MGLFSLNKIRNAKYFFIFALISRKYLDNYIIIKISDKTMIFLDIRQIFLLYTVKNV